MLNIITTTRTLTRTTGEAVQITEWAVGGYTLRKAEQPSYTDWGVVSADRDLPTISDMSAVMAETPVFGVNWSACGTKSSTDARVYAAQLMAAADVADVFNRIVASN